MLLGAAQARALSTRLQVVRRKLLCWWHKSFAAPGVLRRSKISAIEPAVDQSGMCWRNSQHAAGQSLAEHNAVSLRALDVPLEKLLGPRVEHLIASQPALLSDTVANALQLPKVRLESLTHALLARPQERQAGTSPVTDPQRLRTRASTGL